MALGLPIASSSGRPTRRISPRQGRKENAEPINRFRALVPIYTTMDTELSPASQTRASTATCSRGLIDDTKDCSGKEPKERAGLSNDGEAHSTIYRTPNRYHWPHCLWEPPPCHRKTIAGSNIPELRLDRSASRRLMAVESAPATPLGCIQIRHPRTSTVGSKLREARTMVFQECATPASEPRLNKRGQTSHHAEYSGLGRMMVRAKKDKGNPTRQEYPNGKRTKEKRRRGWST